MSLALLKKTVLAAFGEVEQALIAEHFFAQRESAAQQAAAVAIEVAERAGDKCSAVTGDILTLIDATRAKIDNQSCEIESGLLLKSWISRVRKLFFYLALIFLLGNQTHIPPANTGSIML